MAASSGSRATGGARAAAPSLCLLLCLSACSCLLSDRLPLPPVPLPVPATRCRPPSGCRPLRDCERPAPHNASPALVPACGQTQACDQRTVTADGGETSQGMAASPLHHRSCYPGEDQLSAQSGGCDLFHALDADLRSGDFGTHVQQQHEAQHVYQQSHDHRHVSEEQGHMLPPMSSFSQSFPSPGDYHPKYHSFNESPESDETAIDFNQILTMGCESEHDKRQQHQEYIQSFASVPALLYSHFGSDQEAFMSGPEVTFDSSSNAMSHEYLTTDSHVVGSSANSFYGTDGSYVLLSASDYASASSHSMHAVSSSSDMGTSQQKSSHTSDQPHAAGHAAGYPFQSHDQVHDQVPAPHQSQSAGSRPRSPRSAFSHPFTSTDFFVSFGIEDAETSESLIDLQSTLDLLPPTPQPAAQPIACIDDQPDTVAPQHKHFAPQSFPSSGAFPFAPQPTGGLSDEQHPSDALVQKVECFKCKLCDFLCLQRAGVLMHISDKHHRPDPQSGCTSGNNLFACSSCHKSFTSLDQCSKHMEAEHQITTTPSQGLGYESCTTKSSASKSNADAAVSPVPVAQSSPSNASAFPPENHPLVQPHSPARHSEPGQGNIQSEQKNDVSNDKSKSSATKSTSSKKIAWQAKLVREQGSYICSKKKCSVRYLSMENMVRHEKCHMDDGSGFGCSECDKFRSENWSSCAGHLWREHSVDMELHKCEQCSYRSYSLSVLENIHKKIHSSEKNYVCSICQKGFKNQKQLVNHKVRHDKRPGDKTLLSAENKSPPKKVAKECSHECELCGKVFPETRPLRIHMDMVHKKKRPYLCLQCGHSAASKGALRVHIRSHTGEKPFKCEECEYSTSDHNSLRRHKMRHSGERPYKCPFCAYACIQSSTYKQHLRNKHPNQSEGVMFTCRSCGFKTVNEEIFRTHTTEHQKTASGVRLKRSAARTQRHSRSDGESSSSSCSSSQSPPPPPLSSSPESPIMRLARGIVGSAQTDITGSKGDSTGELTNVTQLPLVNP